MTISGDLDIMTSPQLDECLHDARGDQTKIVLDLSAVEFMDTSALAVIVRHWKKVQTAGGSLVLAGARYRYTKTLWITGLAERLTLYDTVAQSLAAFRDGPAADAAGENGDRGAADAGGDSGRPAAAGESAEPGG